MPTLAKTVSGIPILAEDLDHLRSVTLGVWARVGSREEPVEDHGLSHIVEHMVFKGTKKRSAKAIASIVENVGGELNAFTSREYSCFYTRVSWDKFDLAVDVLADLIQSPTFPAAELEKERKVILEEISMYEDQPDEQVQEDLTACLYDQALGHPIAGTRETVATIGRARMLEFYKSRYTPETLFITMVGKLPKGAVRKLAQAFHVPPKRKTSHIVETAPVLMNQDRCRPKKIEQLHVCMANAGLSITHKDRYALHLLSNHLGTGMSSRLFQEIREKRGLAYSVYSFVQSYADTGMFGVYAATSPGKLGEVVDVTLDECARLAARGLPESRLVQLKDMVMGGLQLGLEKAGARMSRMGIGYRYFGRVVPIDEVVAAVQAVSTADLKRVARAIFRGGFDSVTAVGPIKEDEFSKVIDPRKNRTPFVDP